MKYIKFLGSFLAGAILFGGTGIVAASITSNQPTQQPYSYQQFTFFTATTTTATSTTGTGGMFVIKGAKKVDMYFSRGWGTTNTGTSTFSVQGTPDNGTTWVNISKLVQATSTSMQPTVPIEAATSTVRFGLNLDYDAFYGIRCIVNETIDGSHTCKAVAEF